MSTKITEGIKISVRTTYRQDQSQPDKSYYLFSYRIKIENLGERTVQLLKRHWEIFDSLDGYKIVSGEGVVGEKPILFPGAAYEYESACGLYSEIGKMQGYYLMECQSDGRHFSVNIPAFEMYVPHKMN